MADETETKDAVEIVGDLTVKELKNILSKYPDDMTIVYVMKLFDEEQGEIEETPYVITHIEPIENEDGEVGLSLVTDFSEIDDGDEDDDEDDEDEDDD